MSDCPLFPHTWTDGDRLPELVGVLKDVDLAGQTISLVIERPTTVLDKTATIIDSTQGSFKIEWAATDLVAGRGQKATLFIEDASTLRTTLARFLIDVEEDPSP